VKKYIYIVKTFRALLIVAVISAMVTVPVAAWSQPVHMAINNQAVELFKRVFTGYDKYKAAPINFDELYTSVGIADDHKPYFARSYSPCRRLKTMQRWIELGGDWADVPAAYAAVRHFYDPLALSGVHYLTDHSDAFGAVYDQPETDAMTWALSHSDNPFNWRNALIYYKKAMEIPEDGKAPEAFSGSHFKTNVKIEPKDRNKERGIYLGLAYRGLGETMHLLGDMTQPAHVRNDSHPWEEPLEDTITPVLVRKFAEGFSTGTAVDAQMVSKFLSTNGTTLNNPEQLFIALSTFTNRNFYSSDTIYDKDSGIMPRNDEVPIPSPQFKDLIPGVMDLLPPSIDADNGTAKNAETKEKAETINYLGAPFLNDIVLMVQEKLSGIIFKSKSYFVPTNANFTKYQGRVLIPIAIAACSDLMHQFFPTLELIAEFEEPELITEETNGKMPEIRYEIEQEAVMNHKVQNDQAWQQADLSISYTGAGELVFENKGKIYKSIPLSFENGKLTGMQNADKDWVKEKPVLNLRQDQSVKLTKEQKYTEIKDNDSVYIQIKAGSRTWTGTKLLYKFPVETLEADYTEHGLREEENYPGFGVREFAAFCEAVNFKTTDTGDVCYLAPLYTGKAELIFENEKGYIKKKIDVFFEEGVLSKISDTEGNLVDEPLILYGDETAEYKLTDMEKLYEIKQDQTVYFQIRVDRNRYIKSQSWSYFSDFEEIDGTYVGSMTVGATQKLRDFVVDIFAYIMHPLANAIAKLADSPPLSFDEVRGIVDSSTTSNTVTVDIALSIVTVSGNKVAIEFYSYDEYGEATVTSCEGTYQNGLLHFKSAYYDASVFEFSGRLYKDSLYGTIGGSAWGIIGQAVDGEWEADKVS